MCNISYALKEKMVSIVVRVHTKAEMEARTIISLTNLLDLWLRWDLQILCIANSLNRGRQEQILTGLCCC